MESYIESNKIYVLNKNEVLLAVFDKDDEEPIIDPQVQKTQNAESVFTFSISPNNPKWVQINNPENLYVVDGKVYSANFEGCFTEIISESNEDLIQITAYERQKLLSRKFVRAWNSETGFETIDSFMVVILSNGNLSLKNDGNVVSTTYTKGTSGYVLDALLYGTGWTTGICDVQGTFDFETEQVDIYGNILKVQEIWGGILVFDSINKTISHRDETRWLPYNGYEVKYQKNMQSLEKLYNNKIITKLCPLGEGALNIKEVNSGSEWLTNFSYTNTILEGIENNPDIYDAAQLKRWGERKLQDLCKPRTELTVKAALLYQAEGYELERVDLNDIVDVIKTENSDRIIIQLRVVGFTYKLWDYSDATLELSDITLDSTDIFKKNVQATNQINAGTLDTTQVVSFFRAGQTVEKALRNMDNAVAELIIGEDNIITTVKNGGLNLLNRTNDTEWIEISCSDEYGSSAALPNLTDISELELEIGNTITYSLYIKTASGKKLRASICFFDSNSSIISSAYADDSHIIENSQGYSYATTIIPENCKYIALRIDSDLTSLVITGTTTEYVKAEKLEKGAIPTVWTPSLTDYPSRTEVVQTAQGITQTAIASIEIGGRNLILNSESVILQTKSTISQDTLLEPLQISPAFIPKDYAGKEMVLSWYGEASDVTPSSYTRHRYGCEFGFKLEGGSSVSYQGAWRDELFDDWTGRYYSIIKIPANWNGEISAHHLYIQGFESGTNIKIYKPKLELGNKPTDWSRAPEDIDENFSNLEDDPKNLIIDSINKAVDNLNSEAGSRKEYAYINMGQSYMNVADGATVTISFDLEMQVNTARPYIQVYNTNNKGPKQFNTAYITLHEYQVGSVIKRRVAVTSTISNRADADKPDNYIEFYSNYDTSNWFKISNVKLELGSTATPWSPSLKQLSTVMSQTASSFSITAAENSTGTSCGITIKLKNPNGTDLATGDANITLSGLVKFTDLSTSGNTTINGANITTGIIKSANYVSGTSGTSINLSTGVIDTKGFKVNSNGEITSTSGTIGGFTLGATQFSSTLNGNYDYNAFDANTCLLMSMDEVSIPNTFYNIYDINGNGKIQASDALAIQKHANGTVPIAKNVTGTIKINSKDPKNCIQIMQNNSLVVSMGVGGINTNIVSAEDVICGNLSFTDFSGIIMNGKTGVLTSWYNNNGGSELAPSYVSSAEFRNTSLAELKKNIKKLNKTLQIIKNSTIYEYNYKTEDDNERKHKGFVIGEEYNTPLEVMSSSNKEIDIYSMCGILWRGMQEIIERLNIV